MSSMEITYITEEGEEVTVDLPSRRVVCSRCQGHGSHLNPSIGSHAYTQEEFEEAFPHGSEERDAYFQRGGMYDITCEKCKGENVVDVVDEKACRTPEQKAHLKAYRAHLRDQREYEAESRSERMWEARMCGEF